MSAEKRDKVVLAYSGGLDTSVAIHWLQEKYNVDVIAIALNLGQPPSSDDIVARALRNGAIKADFIDVREEFVEDYVWPSLKANAMYQNVYPLSTAIGRPQASFVRAHVLGKLPEESFVDLDNGLVIPCPELLYLRMASHLSPEAHALLAYELAGTYARDPEDPRLGTSVFGVPPVTSVERIRSYHARYGRRNGTALCAHNLTSARDNAWSPMEAIIALLALLPPDEQGYGLGQISLNVRHETSENLVVLGARGSRVPDIEIVGTHVGFNYDGNLHLNLEAILESARTGEDAEKIIREIREKNRDDVLRNRELMAMGRLILPVTSADLFVPGGLDAVMLEAALAREEVDGISAADVRHLVETKSYSEPRQQLIWSLLPWRSGVSHARRVLEAMPWRKPGVRYSLRW